MAEKHSWINTSTATTKLLKYGIEYKTNDNNSVTFYIGNQTYIYYGKSNRVHIYNNETSKIENMNLTLTDFCKLKESENSIKEVKHFNKNFGFIIPFGKYNGKNIKEIYDIDVDWLKWASENFKSDDKIKLIIDECLPLLEEQSDYNVLNHILSKIECEDDEEIDWSKYKK